MKKNKIKLLLSVSCLILSGLFNITMGMETSQLEEPFSSNQNENLNYKNNDPINEKLEKTNEFEDEREKIKNLEKPIENLNLTPFSKSNTEKEFKSSELNKETTDYKETSPVNLENEKNDIKEKDEIDEKYKPKEGYQTTIEKITYDDKTIDTIIKTNEKINENNSYVRRTPVIREIKIITNASGNLEEKKETKIDLNEIEDKQIEKTLEKLKAELGNEEENKEQN